MISYSLKKEKKKESKGQEINLMREFQLVAQGKQNNTTN